MVIYEMMTRRLPYDGCENQQIMMKVCVKKELPDEALIEPGCPPVLVDAARAAPPSASVASAVFVVTFAWVSAWGCWTLRAATESQEPASIALVGLTVASGGRADVARLALGALRWLGATTMLSLPTVLYVLSLYLPSDNALNIGERAGTVLRRGVPFLLALILSLKHI